MGRPKKIIVSDTKPLMNKLIRKELTNKASVINRSEASLRKAIIKSNPDKKIGVPIDSERQLYTKFILIMIMIFVFIIIICITAYIIYFIATWQPPTIPERALL